MMHAARALWRTLCTHARSSWSLRSMTAPGTEIIDGIPRAEMAKLKICRTHLTTIDFKWSTHVSRHLTLDSTALDVPTHDHSDSSPHDSALRCPPFRPRLSIHRPWRHLPTKSVTLDSWPYDLQTVHQCNCSDNIYFAVSFPAVISGLLRRSKNNRPSSYGAFSDFGSQRKSSGPGLSPVTNRPRKHATSLRILRERALASQVVTPLGKIRTPELTHAGALRLHAHASTQYQEQSQSFQIHIFPSH